MWNGPATLENCLAVSREVKHPRLGVDIREINTYAHLYTTVYSDSVDNCQKVETMSTSFYRPMGEQLAYANKGTLLSNIKEHALDAHNNTGESQRLRAE